MSYHTAVVGEMSESQTRHGSAGRAVLSGPEAESDLPRWFEEQRRHGWREFSALPNPHRKDQAWRFSNVDALDLTRYLTGAAVADEERDQILDRSTALDPKSGRLIFANDQLLERSVI